MVAALPPDLDTSAFRSRRLTGALLDEADLVLTMEAAHRTFILDDHPELFRKVFTLGQFAEAVEQAPEGLDRDELLAHLGAARRTADPALDVPDPYRRGPEAASECVARLDELLRAVLPHCPADAPAQEDERAHGPAHHHRPVHPGRRLLRRHRRRPDRHGRRGADDARR